MISYIGKGLAADAKVRMCAAKLLSKCVQGEALHDMLYLFYHMAQTVPDPLCKHTTEDMMTMLVGISRNPIEDAPQFYAKGILSILALNRKCDKVIKAIE